MLNTKYGREAANAASTSNSVGTRQPKRRSDRLSASVEHQTAQARPRRRLTNFLHWWSPPECNCSLEAGLRYAGEAPALPQCNLVISQMELQHQRAASKMTSTFFGKVIKGFETTHQARKNADLDSAFSKYDSSVR